MSPIALILSGLVFFVLAYRFYGTFLNRQFNVDRDRPTPAHTLKDGVDYVPAKTPVLLGHHFASIAGAGPILGPIFASIFEGSAANTW